MPGFFYRKNVLIVGGTGTIGKGLLSAVLQDEPEVVRILSRDEYKQFLLQQQFQEYQNIRYLIGDVRDADRVQRAMQGIDYVFHCASMKQVPACEYNPFEAVQTNIIGTQNVIQAAIREGVKRTIFTSTDKAIAPTNTYGASKLMAERLISAAQNQTGPINTIFAAVRFGNVMGSRGSVIPLFKHQIMQQRKVTVTDLDMTRFMMTIQQATDLTIKAMEIARGGEVFVLKMPVILLKDLVQIIIEEMSYRLGIGSDEIRIEEIGLRPGEKRYEELMTEEEARQALELPDMFVIPNQFLGVRELSYQGSTPVKGLSYNSHREPPIGPEDIRRLLIQQQLIDRDDGGLFQ